MTDRIENAVENPPERGDSTDRSDAAIVEGTFAHTSPYGGSWLEHFYEAASHNVFECKIKSETHFRELVGKTSALPELLIEGNFIVERHAIKSLCRQWGINSISGEDGFFPHYSTLHADPLGFCWESSLPRMIFQNCASNQRTIAQEARRQWLQFERQPLPQCLQQPFVLWPLQLVGDRVNKWDLALEGWTPVIEHFRTCLPTEFQLVIKHHPRSKPKDYEGVDELARRYPNIQVIPASVDLKTLLEQCAAAAGVNSTVLTEARVMFLKPTYAYGRSWFSSHTDLVLPMSHRFPERLPGRFDRVEHPQSMKEERLMDYADWYLYQLLARQMTHDAAKDWQQLRKFVDRLSYHSYLRYGEEIFE